jgi:argininosuccinate lyase
MQQRDDLLTTYGALIEARRTMLTFARTHANAIVPAYTLGVQAQPISMGHYMTGYTAVYERQAELLEQTFDNLNRSPLGAGALGTSSFPIDRVRLATLLGFDAPVRNSFDAVQLSTVDSSMRVVGATSSLAMTTGELMSDLEAQYRLLKPWLTLPSGDMVGGSSMMPQKRNPDIINETRALASEVLGKGATYMFMAHNLPHGFPREQASTPPSEALSMSTRMLRNVAQLFAAFQFDEKRALEEVLSEYSTTTELADMLQRDADMPFRDGHHFASELVNYGRSKGLRPIDIPYEAAQKLFTQLAVEHGAVNKTLPLSAAEFRRALSPQNMVSASRGLGGPQPAEVAAMLKEQEQHLAASTTWLKQKLDGLAAAEVALDRDFSALRK